MGGSSSFIAILSIAAFLACAWLATRISRMMGVSSIVLEITTGVVLGPSVVGVVAPEYAECTYKRHMDCTPPADLSELIATGAPLGETFGMIAESGLCHREDYIHHDDGHATGDDHGAHGVDDHGAATGHDEVTNASSATGHATTTAPPTNADSHGNRTHIDSHAPGTQVGGHEPTTGTQSGNGDGQGRRLSGGGSYATYEECLVKSCEAELSHECQLTPDFFTLIGHAGVALMIFESGMHFDFERAGQVGPKACVVAVVGTILPLVSGSLLTVIFGRPFMPDGVSVGTALAPTSVGIALRLLGEAQVLQEDFGQAIITAAFVDDILSLILFNILFSMTGEFDVMATVVNPIIGIVLMGIAMVAAVKFWPNFINNVLLPRVPEFEDAKVSRKDEALFLLMMCVLITYATITYFLGTHLWGCFMAGMSFACLSNDHHAHHVWVKQTKRATSWMIRIFFAATVAFSIPVGKLLSFDAFWKGSLMGIGPCILSKVLCAPFMGHAKFVIGWAMVGRAEFAYLIAQMAAAAGMVDQATFSIVIWALLYATVFAPFLFRKVLNNYVRDYCQDALKDNVDSAGAEDNKVQAH